MGKEKYSPKAICKLVSNLMTPLLHYFHQWKIHHILFFCILTLPIIQNWLSFSYMIYHQSLAKWQLNVFAFFFFMCEKKVSVFSRVQACLWRSMSVHLLVCLSIDKSVTSFFKTKNLTKRVSIINTEHSSSTSSSSSSSASFASYSLTSPYPNASLFI